MLSWQVGRVKITRIVEMDLPVPARFMREATTADLKELLRDACHFVKSSAPRRPKRGGSGSAVRKRI